MVIDVGEEQQQQQQQMLQTPIPLPTIGKYQALDEIATGGQGAVYRAFDKGSGRIVAVKVLHSNLSRDVSYVARFQREASMIAAIKHPNVVEILELGQDQYNHFIVLEYLPTNLNSLIQGLGAMPPDRAVALGSAIADGLTAAHQREIVHRDIKPQNVLISADGVPKITDFGIARAENFETMTATGSMMGSPYYMAPEQATGRADVRSDVYALGCVLYQLLTGQLPFVAETPFAVIRMHERSSYKPMRELNPEVPKPVAEIIDQALAKSPKDRFANAGGMATALRMAMPNARPVESTTNPPAPMPVTPMLDMATIQSLIPRSSKKARFFKWFLMTVFILTLAAAAAGGAAYGIIEGYIDVELNF